MSSAVPLPALGLPNVQEWIIIAVVAVLLFGRRLPEVIAQVLHGIRVARQHLDELRRSSGFDEDLREAQRTLRETRETIKREARELTAPLPTIQGAKDAVRREFTGIGAEIDDGIEDAIRRTPPPGTPAHGEAGRLDPGAPRADAPSAGGAGEDGGEANPEAVSDADERAPSLEERGPDPEPRDPDR